MRRFRPFRDAHDHLGDILAILDAEQSQRCFVAWVAAPTGTPEGVIAIDGKTLRRSGQKKGVHPAIHMVPAFAARQRLVLGKVKVAEKSNEIRVDEVPIAIHRPIQVAPATMNLEVGFVDVPALTRAASCAVTPLAQRLTHHGQQLRLPLPDALVADSWLCP